MGVQGLRKFIEGQSCTRTVAPDANASADHVLFDTNSLVHRAYSKEHTHPQQTIDVVIERATVLLTETVRPRVSVTFAFDGPAPIAKLNTQRLRRRKVQAMDVANNNFFSDLSITAGSTFMVQLENELAKAMAKLLHGSGIKLFIFGSTVMGEGEFKISQALNGLALRKGSSINETCVIIGNDIDLTLTCFGATCFHNLSVLGPMNGQLFDISLILERWIATNGNGFAPTVWSLATTRIDLTFLFLLNGGDHYVGLGESAVELWKKYRLVKSQNPDGCLVSTDLTSVDSYFLGQLLSVDQYTGEADPKSGLDLLRAALWSCCSTVSGTCLDYQYLGGKDLTNPTLSHLKACVQEGKPIVLNNTKSRNPLSPLGTFVALMPRVDLMPKSVKKILLQNEPWCLRLLNSTDPHEVVQVVQKVVGAAKADFSAVDTVMNTFTKPVAVSLSAVEEPHDEHPKRKRGGRRLHAQRATQPKAPVDVNSLQLSTTTVEPPEVLDFHSCQVNAKERLVFSNPFDPQGARRTFKINQDGILEALASAQEEDTEEEVEDLEEQWIESKWVADDAESEKKTKRRGGDEQGLRKKRMKKNH